MFVSLTRLFATYCLSRGYLSQGHAPHQMDEQNLPVLVQELRIVRNWFVLLISWNYRMQYAAAKMLWNSWGGCNMLPQIGYKQPVLSRL
jgi:hypothetical protein